MALPKKTVVFQVLVLVSLCGAAPFDSIDAVSSASGRFRVTGGSVYDTAATLIWWSEYADMSLVLYWGISGECSDSMPLFPYTAGTDTPVVLNGLVPDTTYRYRVGGVHQEQEYDSLLGGTFTTAGRSSDSLLKIVILPDSASIRYGEKTRFRAFGLYSDSSIRDISLSGAWSVVPASLGTLLPGGWFQPARSGEGMVFLRVDSMISSVTVTVPVRLTALSLTPLRHSVTTADTVELSVTAFYSDATSREISDDILWTVMPRDGARVSFGRLYPLEPGEIFVQASVEEATSQFARISVRPAVSVIGIRTGHLERAGRISAFSIGGRRLFSSDIRQGGRFGRPEGMKSRAPGIYLVKKDRPNRSSTVQRLFGW